MKEEITGGIRNAMEHGASLEDAGKSFISAGYSEKEINDAVQELSFGASSMVHSEQKNDLNAHVSIPLPSTSPPPQKKSIKTWMLVLLLVFIIIIAGAIVFTIFSDKIIQFISNL